MLVMGLFIHKFTEPIGLYILCIPHDQYATSCNFTHTELKTSPFPDLFCMLGDLFHSYSFVLSIADCCNMIVVLKSFV